MKSRRLEDSIFLKRFNGIYIRLVNKMFSKNMYGMFQFTNEGTESVLKKEIREI